jgi:hypothetical protein
MKKNDKLDYSNELIINSNKIIETKNNMKRFTSKQGGPKQRILNNKYFISLDDFNEIIKDYTNRGKTTNDKLSRKKLTLDIFHEFLRSNDKYLSAKYLLELIKEKKYQKDCDNSFLRIIYYPLLVSDELFDGKTLAEKVFSDVAVPGNPKYPNFKILKSKDYDLSKIKLRPNINGSITYNNTLEEIIDYTKSINTPV